MAVITECQQPCKWESSTAQAHRQGCSLSIAQEKGKGVQPDSMTSSSEDRHHHNLFEIQRRCNFTKTVSNAFLRHKRIKKLERISTSTKLAQFCSDEVRLYKKNHSPECKLKIIIASLLLQTRPSRSSSGLYQKIDRQKLNVLESRERKWC
jgi:hypothetical protein